MRGMGQIPVERSGRTPASDPLAGGRSLVERAGRDRLPRGHPHPRPRPVADARQDRRGADRPRARRAAHPDGALGHAEHHGQRTARSSGCSRAKRVDVVIGDPVDLSAYRGRQIDQQTLGEATELVMRAITALLEELRGEKAPADRWDPAKHNQKEIGRFERPPTPRRPTRPRRRGSGGLRRPRRSRWSCSRPSSPGSPCSVPAAGAPRSRRCSPRAGADVRCGPGAPRSPARSPRPSATATTCPASTCPAP